MAKIILAYIKMSNDHYKWSPFLINQPQSKLVNFVTKCYIIHNNLANTGHSQFFSTSCGFYVDIDSAYKI